MNGKIHFGDGDVYLAWNDGKPTGRLEIKPGGAFGKAKALCGNIMNNNVSNFFGYDSVTWKILSPNKVTCKRCIAEMKKLGL